MSGKKMLSVLLALLLLSACAANDFNMDPHETIDMENRYESVPVPSSDLTDKLPQEPAHEQAIVALDEYGFPPISDELLERKSAVLEDRKQREQQRDRLKEEWLAILVNGGLIEEDNFDGNVTLTDEYAMIRVSSENESETIIFDRTGQIMLAFDTWYFWGFEEFGEETVAIITHPDSYDLGLMNMQGEWVLEPKYHNILSGSDHLVLIESSADNYLGRYNILTESGYFDPEYEEHTVYKTQYVDRNGNELFPAMDGIGCPFEGEYALIQLQGERKISYINRSGEVVLREITYPLAYMHYVSTNGPNNPYVMGIYHEEKNYGLPDDVVNYRGQTADIQRDCGDFFDEELLYIGVWEFQDDIFWLGDNREARFAGDDRVYHWTIANRYSSAAIPILVIQSEDKDFLYYPLHDYPASYQIKY